jgi:hypothetical protein
MAGCITGIIFDANTRYIRVGKREWGPGLDLKFEDNIPTVDYAIVLLTAVSRFGNKQRVIAVGGLTTYGTHAGAHFVSHYLPSFARAERLGKAPNVCIVVRAALVGGQPYDIRPLLWIPLPDIGVPMSELGGPGPEPEATPGPEQREPQ